ncbi:MAG: metallophosphoesterase family protein, partial [Kiritimatiellae bacterium]|nr:metallophosphoesterase family protein [Kiritimatiellia bacterium]
ARQAPEAPADPFLGTRGEPLDVGAPCLQAPGETTMGVSWAVSGLSKGVVEVADNPDFRDSRIVKSGGYGLVPIDVSALQVRLEGLRPSTKYWYRTITTPFTDYKDIYNAKLGEPMVSAPHSFTTLGPGARPHFCMICDTHAKWAPFQMIVKKVKELAPAAVVWNGDATNTTQKKRTAVEIFLDPPIEDRDWSADIPVLFESGNHDFRGSWISKKEEVVMARHPAERRGDQWDLKWNFAVRCGEMALIGMDTGEDKPDGHPKWFGLANFSSYRRAQAKWLEEQFARPDIAGAKFKVLFCHIPLWPRNDAEANAPYDGTTIDPKGYAYWSRECRDLWAPIFEKGGVQLVVTGHKHKFDFMPATAERPWAMVIGGGPELGVVRGKPAAERFPTVVEGRVVDGRLRLAVHNVLSGETVLDEAIA